MQFFKEFIAPIEYTEGNYEFVRDNKTYFLCPSCARFSYGQYGTLCDTCLADLQLTYCWHYEEMLHFQEPAALGLLEHILPLFMYGSNTNIRSLIFRLKYHGDLPLGYAFGHILGRELLAAGLDIFDGIVPVPLHWFKYLRRGYNQSEVFARGIAEVLGIPVCKVLQRKTYRKSQTKVTQHEARSLNVEGVFALKEHKAEEYAGQHLLLVDDVLTTGSTASECINCLQKIPDIQLSFGSIAVRPTLLRLAYGQITDNREE